MKIVNTKKTVVTIDAAELEDMIINHIENSPERNAVHGKGECKSISIDSIHNATITFVNEKEGS